MPGPTLRPALCVVFGLCLLITAARSAEACGTWALLNEETKASLRFAAHTVTLYEGATTRKVGWLERKGDRWFARRSYEEHAWSKRPGDAPALMTLTSTAVFLPTTSRAPIKDNAISWSSDRYTFDIQPKGRDRYAVSFWRNNKLLYSGEARAVCGAEAFPKGGAIEDVRARLILGAFWLMHRNIIELEATPRATDEQLRLHSTALRRCWEKSLMSDGPPDGGRIDVALELGPDRRVTEVELSGPASRRGVLARCLKQEVGNWRFPSGVGPSARFPLILHGDGS